MNNQFRDDLEKTTFCTLTIFSEWKYLCNQIITQSQSCGIIQLKIHAYDYCERPEDKLTYTHEGNPMAYWCNEELNCRDAYTM